MSRTSVAILFATIALIVAATYLEVPYFGDGVGVLLVTGLCYAFVVAKREMALMTYVLSEDQIVEEPERKKPAPVPQGLS